MRLDVMITTLLQPSNPLATPPRMRKIFLTGVLLAVASTAQAQPVQVPAPLPGSTTIDFNSLPAFTTINNQYSGFGVTVSSSCFNSSANYSSWFSNDPMQATNFDQSDRDCAGGTAYPTVTFNFSSPINYFGLMGLTNNNITLTDANGSITVFTAITAGGARFAGFTDVSGTSFVTISADVNGAFAIDDVSFSNITATPEPSSAILLLTGIAGFGAVARRRRSKA